MWLKLGAVSGHTRCIVTGLYHTSALSLTMQSSCGEIPKMFTLHLEDSGNFFQSFTSSLLGHLWAAGFPAPFWFFLCLAPPVLEASGFAAVPFPPPISFEFIASSNELFCEHFIHVFFLICISQNISHWKLLYCTLNKNSPFHRCSLRSQGLCMGSLSLSMRFWLQGTSRRQDRFASTHPLAPSSENTPAAPVSVGTRVQPPRLPRASGRTTPASPNPQVGCTGEGEGGSKGEQRGTGSVASGSRSWRGVGTGQGVVCWLHGFHGFLAEWGVSGSISYCSGGQSAPPPRMVNLQCGCRVNLVFTQTCFQLSMFSCLLAHFCDYQHHPLPVRHRCQH